MATINREFFITQFKEEVNEHVQRIAQRLFQFEEHPAEKVQIVEEIFRTAHTLKGSARMMGFSDISEIAHKMEDLLVEIRDDHLKFNATAIDLLFYALDTINYLIEGVSKHVKRSANLEQIGTLFQDVIAGKQIEVPHLETRTLEPTVQKTPPPARPIEDEEPAFDQLPEAEARQYVRIHTRDLDAILNLVGEVLINQHRYEGQRAEFQEIIHVLRHHQQYISELQKYVKKENTQNGARLELLVDDVEHSASGLLRKTKNLLKKARNDGQQMELAMNELQEQVIDIRMVPASRIFHLFHRLVRMTSRKLGKLVDLKIFGEDTKIDSRIIEEMRDPLIHLLQNAIRHGIEVPDNRRSLGKDPTGTVLLSASQEGNRIVIRVQDDGRGIHLEQIKEHALKHRLLSPRDVNTISEQALFEVLFQPGFSTTETIDDIAGRGFGLNIVRTHVDRVQGEIEVHAQPGKGTEFVIKLPLTLTITNALFVRVEDHVFAIPAIAIEKSFDVSAREIEYLGNMPAALLDGQFLPLVALRQILGFPPSHADVSQKDLFLGDADHKTVIVIQAEERRIGFIVDDLVEEREIVIKNLGPCLKRIKNIAGATTVRGEALIILYVRDLVRSADAYLEGYTLQLHNTSSSDTPETQSQAYRSIVPRILLVDDSLNTRDVERAILEEAGYEVETAENGVEAFKRLQHGTYHLVVTDIEMPEMNGIQLIQRIREEEQFDALPILVVSTKKSDNDKTLAYKAGAQAYLCKSEFNEHLFVETVDTYLRKTL